MSTPDETAGSGRTPHPEEPAEGASADQQEAGPGRTRHAEDPPAEG